MISSRVTLRIASLVTLLLASPKVLGAPPAADISSLKECSQIKKCFAEPGANSSFKMTHSPRASKVLLAFHGLSDSPYFMKDIAARAFAKGYDVIAPTLDGHGTRVEDMLRVTDEQWIATSERWFAAAKNQWKSVSLAGFSTGGMLSIRLAGLYRRQIDHVLLFAPAVKIANPKAYQACPYTSVAKFGQSLPVGGSIVNSALLWFRKDGEYTTAAKNPTPVKYATMTTASVCALYTMTQDASRFLASVTAPITAVITADDTTIVPMEQLNQVAASSSSAIRILVLASEDSYASFDHQAKSLMAKRRGLAVQTSKGIKVQHGAVPVESNAYNLDLANPQFKTLEGFVF